MTRQRSSAWSALADEWSDDHPAIARMRDALALQPTPEPAQDAPRAEQPPTVESNPTSAPVEAPEESKRGRIGELIARVQAGDLSAIEALRRALDKG